MVQKFKVAVAKREEKTPNQLRREGKVPATLYGPGQPSENVQVDAKEFGRLPNAAYSHMIELEFGGGGKPVNALIREVQRRSTVNELLNIEFYRVNLDKVLTVSVPLKFVGTAPALLAGGQVLEVFQEAEIECLPTDIPDYIEVDLTKLVELEDVVHFNELPVPKGVKLLHNGEEVVVKAITPRAAKEETKEETPAAAAAAAPEAAPAT